MKKQLKKFGSILFLSGALLFLGCQTEELTVSDTRVESGIVHRHIDFETFSRQFPKPAEKLLEQNEKTSNKMQRGGVYDPMNDFTILTDYIFMAERDGETYFTFAISREEQTFAGLENLVLVPDGQGGFSPLLTQYSITESEKSQIAEGVEIQDLENKMAVEPLDGVDFGGVVLPRSDDGCWTLTVSYCSADLHMGGLYENGEDCEGHTEIVISFGCGGSEGGGDSGSGPGTYPGTSTPGNNTGGSGYGPGGPPSTGTPNNGTPPLDGNQDPGTGGPNPGTGGGKKPMITGPVYIPEPPRTVEYLYAYISPDQRGWLTAHNGSAAANQIYSFTAANNYDSYSMTFVRQFIQSCIDTGLNLDFNKSLKSPMNVDMSAVSGNSPEEIKFNKIYNILKDSSPKFRNLFEYMFRTTEFINSKFKIQDIPQNSSGHTSGYCRLISSNYGALSNEIVIDRQTLLTASDVNIAQTIIHECVHAYLNIKLRHPSIGMTIDGINNMNLAECINTYYNGFAGSQTQHDFFVTYMAPTIADILNEIKTLILTPQQIRSVEIPQPNSYIYEATATVPSNKNYNAVIPWNWTQYFKHLSFMGLQNCSAYQFVYAPNSQNLLYWTQYISIGIINFTP